MIDYDADQQAFLDSSESPNWTLQFWFGQLDLADRPTIGGVTNASAIIYSCRSLGWSRADYAFFTGLINYKAISNIPSKVRTDQMGGLSTTSTVRIKISNHGDHADVLDAANATLEGARVRILITPDAATAEGDQLFVWQGFVKEYDENDEYIEITLENSWKRYEQKLPKRIFNPNESDWETSRLKSEIRGKAVPMVFGDHEMATGYTIADIYDDGSNDRGVLVQFADTNPSGTRAIESIEDVRYGHSGLIEATGGMGIINTDSGKSEWTSLAASGQIYFDDPLPERLYLKLFIECRSFTTQTNENDGQIDPENGLDGDDTTNARVPAATDVTLDDSRSLCYKIPHIGLGGTIEGGQTSQRFYFVGKLTPENASKWDANRQWGVSVEYATDISNNDGFAFYNPSWYRTNTTGIDNWDTPADWEDYQMVGQGIFGLPTQSNYDSLADLNSCFLCPGVNITNGSADTGYLDVYQAALWVHCYIDWPGTGFYARVKGYRDDSAGNFTGTANQFMQNGCHIVAFIWGLFSSATSSGVITSSFQDLASNERSGYNVARQLLQREDVTKIIDKLAQEIQIFVRMNELGRVETFPMSPPSNDNDYWELRPAEVALGRLKRKLTRVSELKTSFRIRFRPNPVTDDYEDVVICTPTEKDSDIAASYQTLCQDALVRAGNYEQELDVDLDWVRERSVALLVAQRLIATHTQRRWILEWRGELKHLAREVGDPMKLDNLFQSWQQLPASVLDGSYRLTEASIIPSRNEIKYVALEVVE